MLLLTWHGTFVCLHDQNGTMRHLALPAPDDILPLEIDRPESPGQAAIRHPELGMLQTEAAPEPGAIRLLRDGLYMCAEANTGQVVFNRSSAAAWESFLPLSAQDAADLGLILRYRWIVRTTRRVIHRRQIGVRDGFKLRIGPYTADLATSLSTLATRRGDNGLPTAIALKGAGDEIELVVAEPRSSALVQTEMWPPRARRVAEILAFAVHRQVMGLEPTQDEFERDVSFLQERQGAAGLEDLLENIVDRAGPATGAAHDEPSESAFEAGLAAVKAYVEAAQTSLALAALERLAETFPNDADLWFRLGEMRFADGAYGAAQAAWETCLSHDPGHRAAGLRLANIAAYFGKPLESIARLGALVAAAPEATEPRAFLAQRYAELDWLDLVAETFAPVAGTLGDWKEANRRGLAQRYDEHLKRFDALTAQKPPLSPLDAIQQARLALSLGRLDVCADLLRALPASAAERADAHMVHADLRLRRDGLDAAIASLEAVDGTARQHAGLIVTLARLHVAASRTEEAAASLFALAQHTPRSDALRLLCMIAHQADDHELLRFATERWSALHEGDTMASQWAITEAWSDGRLLRVEDALAASAGMPVPLIMQFWDTAERPVDVVLAMQTWQNRHPGIIHSVFDDALARAFMADHCAAEVLACYEAAHHPAMQSDIFRLAYLFVRGGIYVDADDVCTRDMSSIFAALAEVDLIAVRSNDTPPYIHNNFIAARPRCAIIADALQDTVKRVLAQTRSGERPDIWQTTGPGALTRAIARFTADTAHQGRVMLLSESEYRSFSLTQDMPYKHQEDGDWRLLKAASPMRATLPRTAPAPSQTSDVLMGWAMREIAPWELKPVSHTDAARFFERLDRTHGWIAVFTFADGLVTVGEKAPHLPVSKMIKDRTEFYLTFFRSLTPFLPVGFKTTICMGMGDSLPSPFDVPVFGFQKKIGWNTLLMPDVDFLHLDFYTRPLYQDQLTYHDKMPGAVFAGGTSGGHITPQVARDFSIPRLRAANFFANSEKVDFRLPSIVQCSGPEAEALLRAQPFCQKPKLNWQEQFRRRMILSMDGNGATCARVAVALQSHSVLLKYESQSVLYYFGGLQPWVHYVPVSDDSEVEKLVDLDARDPEHFARIAENGRHFAQAYLTADSARRYAAMLLQLYENAFSDTAVPIKIISAPDRIKPPLPGVSGVVLAHIQNRGDRTVPLGEWQGEPGSARAIEGFAVSLPPSYPAGLSYAALTGPTKPAATVRDGAYSGTRGENMPIFGFVIAAEGEFAARYSVAYEASFVDGTLVGPVPAGTLCTAPSGQPLEAMRVRVSERK